MKLTREIRCWANEPSQAPPTHRNSWAGSGGDDASDAFWVLRAAVEGKIDPKTGYVCDIRAIDNWLRDAIAPAIQSLLAGRSPGAARCLYDVVCTAGTTIARSINLESLEWQLSPYTRYTVTMTNPTVVSLTRSYEFSAAHRLACADYSDEQNRRVFGKCSNPLGHGHNYVFEVTVRGTPHGATGQVLPVVELDRVVSERVIEAFDHRNLNAECPEFAELNPSVENIARVIFKRIEAALSGTRLASVRVWETPKTSATCAARDSG